MANTSESEFDKTVGIEIQGWILDLSAVTFDAVLRDLELTPGGTPFARVDRLYRRLRGDYTTADFVESDNAESELAAQTRREQRLCNVLKKANFSEETLAHIALKQVENLKQTDESGFAPLANSSANVSDTTDTVPASGDQREARDTQNDKQTTNQNEMPQINTIAQGELYKEIPPITLKTVTTTTSTHSISTASGIHSQTTSTQPKTIFSTTENKNREEDIVFCKLTDGATYAMPRRLAMEMVKAQQLAIAKEQEVNALRQHIAEVASSTRIQPQPTVSDNAPRLSKNVNFQDTFELNYFDANRETDDAPHNQQQQNVKDTNKQRTSQLDANAPSFQAHTHPKRQTQLHTALPTPFGWQESGRGEYPPGAALGQSTQLLPDVSRALVASGDVGRTVRQWKVRFAGEKGESIEEFIQRVEECRRLAHISDADLLNALSELLSGVALHWCRHSRTEWSTWADFCKAARRCYGVEQNFQQRLMAEAQARKQGRKEPVRDYIFCLLTIFSRLEAPPSTRYQLDMLYANMLPALRKLVPKEKVTGVNALVQLAREAEELLDEEQNFPAPLLPEQSVLPSVAYKEPEERGKKGVKPASDRAQVNIASVAQPSSQYLAKMVAEILDERLRLLNAPFGKSQMRQIQARGPRWAQKRGTPRKLPDNSKQNRVTIVEVNEDSDKDAQGSTPRPARNRNQSNEAGPRARVYCFSCGWPGYIKSTCPECSGNAERGE